MNNNTVGNRIRTLRRNKKLSQPELAKLAQVGQSTISDLENDKKSTSAKNLAAIAKVLSTSSNYLLTGKEPSIDEINAEFNNAKYLDSFLYAKESLGLFNEDMIEVKYFKDVPFSCGGGGFGEALETEENRISVSKQALLQRGIVRENCIALPAIGDSMSPTIKDGDVVYVDLGRCTIKDGRIFAVCHGGLFKFKRLYQLPLGGIRVVSDNNIEYPEERLSAQDIIDQKFEVIGWAWSWQTMETW